MHRTTLELMRTHVREIHQALTGKDLPEENAPAAAPSEEISPDGVMRLFADLESAARTLPDVSERIPPFSFAPPIDLLENEKELVAEVAVPGVEKEDVEVEAKGDTLTINGVRTGTEQNGYRFRHAEIARGPFHRVVRLPQPVTGEPRVQVQAGVIRVQLTKAPAGAHPN